MAEFSYKAKNGPKEIVEGKVVAATKQEAMRLIDQKGLTPLEVIETSSASVAKPAAPPKTFFKRKVTVYEICVFTRQMAGFMRSQIPLMRALESITNEMPKGTRFHEILTEVTADVRGGKKFSDSLQEHGTPYFDLRFISMVRAGESGGTLADVLETLADFLEREEETRGQVKSALAYPVLVLLVGFGTIFFLFTFCIPRLTVLFKQSFSTLPLPTKILMALSAPGWQAMFFSVFFMVVGLALFVWMNREKYKRVIDGVIIRLPFFGMIRLKSDISRFCSTLAMLLKNGIPVYQAIEVTRPVLSNEVLNEELSGAQKRILGGEMLTNIIRDSPSFPHFVAQMVAVGEESGRLSESLEEAARFYSRESIRDVKVVTSLIEPMFILGLSLVVGFVVMGVMLPIFDMNWVK